MMIIRFLAFGMIGWCMEVAWTGLAAIARRDRRAVASTSIWMFFIYGSAAFLSPLCDALIGLPVGLRGAVYAICIFAVEFAAGSLLKRWDACPWDYSGSRFAVAGVIRLDYAPVWFGVGLLFEFVHFTFF